MTRYWINWVSGNYADEGCTNPPFQFWRSGSRDRKGDTERDDLILCAVVDCVGHPDDHYEDIRAVLKQHFPDFEERFIEAKPSDWTPGDRFPDFEGRTSLGSFTLRTKGLA
jgi:hypothetical protein